MNVKKSITSVLAVLLSVGAFAYPAIPDDDQTAQLLQQYVQQTEQALQEFQKQIAPNLVPSLKALAGLALEVQTSNTGELTAEQETRLNKYTQNIDNALTELLAPALKDFDLAQFNEQYAQTLKDYGLPEHQFTLEEATDMLTVMYLSMALLSCAQAKSLSEDELAVLAEIFFPQQEEPVAQ